MRPPQEHEIQEEGQETRLQRDVRKRGKYTDYLRFRMGTLGLLEETIEAESFAKVSGSQDWR